MSEEEKNIVDIKRKRKPKPTPLPDTVSLDRVTEFSMLRMSDEHTAILLGISMELYEALRDTNPSFQWALEKGRADACRACATILLQAAQGKLLDPKTQGFGAREAEMVRSAREYLRSHAPNWMADY